jgi:uncharacterized membrane protein
MEWLEHSENIFGDLVKFGEFILELCSFLCIAIGFIQLIRLVISIKGRRNIRFPFIEVRLRFGLWLSLALEFQLAADILLTTLETNLQSLAKLGSIAVIRTFLNYFLNKELQEEIEWKEKNQE